MVNIYAKNASHAAMSVLLGMTHKHLRHLYPLRFSHQFCHIYFGRGDLHLHTNLNSLKISAAALKSYGCLDYEKIKFEIQSSRSKKLL